MNKRLSALDDSGWPAKSEDYNLAWVANPRCECKRENEQLLIDRRADLIYIAGVDDPTACYSYDEAAVVKLDNEYFLLQTSGCSCPSPSETWGVVVRGTLEDVRSAIERGEYGGYTLPPDELAKFLSQLAQESAGEE